MAKKLNLGNKATTAIAYIVIGALLCIFKSQTLNWLLVGTGILCIALGIYYLMGKDMTSGIIYVAVGVVLILGGWLFVELALIILGVLLALRGVVDLADAMKTKRNSAILSAVITITVGILLVLGKFVMVDWFFVILGAILVVDGILILVGMKK